MIAKTGKIALELAKKENPNSTNPKPVSLAVLVCNYMLLTCICALCLVLKARGVAVCC